MITTEDLRNSTIIIVSDNPMRLKRFAEDLQDHGFVIEILDSREQDILEFAEGRNPDLIILDVFRTGRKELDMCRRIAQHEQTRDIPVIFMTTLTETVDKVQGFEAGGVDYISRPFSHEEALARITAHLRIKSLQKNLRDKNHCLQEEIAQRQKTEEALRESEERFKALADATFEGVIIHEKGLIVEVNHMMEEMFNSDRSELIGKNALDLMMAELSDGILGNIHSNYENLIEAEGARKDGTTFPVEIQAKEIPFQGRSARVAAIRDVTWRKQVENALEESRQYIRNIIESSLDMIIAVDCERKIVEFNRSAQQVFGYTADEAIGQSIELLYADSEESSQMHQSMVEQGQVIQEVKNRRKNGEIFPCLLSASTLWNAKGENIGYMGISRDITEQKRAQAELMAAHNELKEKNEQLRELNASKDKFFSIISHDLKNPFSILLGLAELLTLNAERYDREKIQTLVFRLYASAQKLYALLENLLTWSKIQRGLMECMPVNLNLHKHVEENIELFNGQIEKKHITLLNTTPSDITAWADESMLNAVLRNLISNALKYTNNNGQVRIACRELDRDFWEVSISDSGVGIPKDMLPKLLRIDTQYTHVGTAGEEGSGLGLILCRELVEQNGGTLRVESEPGRGTTFHFTLPRQPLESFPSK